MVFEQLENTGMMFFIAILLGIGLSNVWPTAYICSVLLMKSKFLLLACWISIDSVFWIPLTQVIIVSIWSSVSDSDNFAFYISALLGLIAVIGFIVVAFYQLNIWNFFETK